MKACDDCKNMTKDCGDEVDCLIFGKQVKVNGCRHQSMKQNWASYHSGGIVVKWNGGWIFLNDETKERLNQIITDAVEDKKCHQTMYKAKR